tara:strand:+ start:31342 stop:32412 length:1071 start_codon:yes stop_codon:yes gene_type:complete
MRLISLTKSLEGNSNYTGFKGELVSIPLVGVAVHDGINAGGTILTEQAELNRNGVDNIVRNSNFQFTQNGTSWTGNAGNDYISDGWYMQHGGGSTSNAAQVTTYEPLLNQSTYLRVTTFTGGASNSFSLLSQRYSRLVKYTGQELTISYWVKSNVTTSLSGECGLSFADAGTADRKTLINRVTLQANTWQKVEQTFTVPAISNSDVIDDTQDHMYIYFWLDAGDDFNDRTGGILPFSGTFDIGNIKVEYGSQATAYNTMSYRDEEKKVHEYYEKRTRNQFLSSSGTSTHATTTIGNFEFKNAKWSDLPTVTYSATFISGDSIFSRDAYGFTLIGTATEVASSARISEYIANAEIAP